MDEKLQLIVDDALRAVERQSHRLDELRSRAGTLITAGSLIVSFVGTSAVTGDRTAVGILGVLAFLTVLGCLAYILLPRSEWRFARPGNLMLESYDLPKFTSPDAMARAYAKDLGEDYAENDKLLGRLTNVTTVAIVALAVEAVALLCAAAA